MLLEVIDRNHQEVQGIKSEVQEMRFDLQEVRQEMHDQDNVLTENIGHLATKEELYALKEELQEEIRASEKHVLAAVEHKRYEDSGIINDQFTEHGRRLDTLERKTGLIA